jgi:hypothetical protein
MSMANLSILVPQLDCDVVHIPSSGSLAGFPPGTEIYSRVHSRLAHEHEAIERILDSLRKFSPSPDTEDQQVSTDLAGHLTQLLSAHYPSLFSANTDLSHQLKALTSRAISPALSRLLSSQFAACVHINRVRSILSLADFDPQATHSISPANSLVASARLRPSDSTLLCRLCEHRIPVDLVESHMASCRKAFESSHVMKQKDKDMLHLAEETERAELLVEWPGEPFEAVPWHLPLLHALLMLRRVAKIDWGTAEACSEITRLSVLMKQIPLPRSLAAFRQKALSLIKKKLTAVTILAAAMDAVKQTIREQSMDIGPTEAKMADFMFLKRISSGGYSKVFLARKVRTGDLYAIKAIPKASVRHKNDRMRILAEKEIMLSVSARHMVNFCIFRF